MTKIQFKINFKTMPPNLQIRPELKATYASIQFNIKKYNPTFNTCLWPLVPWIIQHWDHAFFIEDPDVLSYDLILRNINQKKWTKLHNLKSALPPQTHFPNLLIYPESELFAITIYNQITTHLSKEELYHFLSTLTHTIINQALTLYPQEPFIQKINNLLQQKIPLLTTL